MGEAELKNLLKQPASLSANMYLRLNPAMPEAQKTAAQKSVDAQDDLWCLARMVCFGKLEEDKSLKISKPYVELVDGLVIKYGDEEMLEAWSKIRPQEYVPEAPSYGMYGGGYGTSYAPVYSFAPNSFAPPLSKNASTPTYPSSPPESPKYIPSSPPPSSPAYAPSSPIDELIEDTKKKRIAPSLYDDL
jgi:hypothetical protein